MNVCRSESYIIACALKKIMGGKGLAHKKNHKDIKSPMKTKKSPHMEKKLAKKAPTL